MFLKGLAWSFAGLFILFSLIGLAVTAGDDAAWHPIWGGLSVLSLGGFALAMVADALSTGQIRARFSVVRRADRPWLFGSTVAVIAAAGVIVIVGGLWLLIAGTGA